jgi:hypothetical protein
VQRGIKRPVAAAVGCALLAVIAVGAAVAFGGRTAPASNVVSRWSGGGSRVVSGSLRNDPERGFVRLSLGRKTFLFTTPEGAGALRLISHTSYLWTLRASNGALALLSPGLSADIKIPPSFQYLGPRLDPAKLGTIGPRGVAVLVDLPGGKIDRRAVVLVEQTPGAHGSFGNGWKVDGYLPGFTTPREAALEKAHFPGPLAETARALQEPLLGPGGKTYSIDAKAGRLVQISRPPAETFQGAKLGGCTTWPGANGASYKACSRGITLRPAHGAATTILREDPRDQETIYNTAWTFLQPSPNGKWLLLEDSTEACSFAWWVEFMSVRGGSFSELFPGSNMSSFALGWLPDNTALVEGAPATCGGGGPAGIYQARPGAAGSPQARQLVFPDWGEATTWGFGR